MKSFKNLVNAPKEGTVIGERANYHVYGIKCDSCDYSDMSVPYSDYPQWLNKPCPSCGDNLLTESDYKSCQAMIAASEAMNRISESDLADTAALLKTMSKDELAQVIDSLPQPLIDAMPELKAIAKEGLSNANQDNDSL